MPRSQPQHHKPKRTAQGSHKTYGGWESKTCCKCGGRLTLEGPACIWSYIVPTGQAFSFHIGACP